MRSPTIMLVEDDPELRLALEEALQSGGYDVIACSNGEDALNRIHNAPKAGVILLDLYMPGSDGWAFRAIQRHLQGHGDVPLVVMSAAKDLPTVAEQMGAVEYLQKPVTVTRVLEVVRSVLSKPLG